MCGIAGIVNSKQAPVEPQLLWRMISTLNHRGPDDGGVFAERNVGLAHARLSIIDLAGGHQPMSIENGSLWITFNGEIFNYIELREELERKGHHFRSRSDTEVILRMYLEKGEECTRYFNGQWAFAIWDSRDRKLFLSRDRYGVRPLFYTTAGGDFLFASEIKALLAHPAVHAEIDLRALDQIFTFWVTTPPRTAFKDVSQLPPGHSLVLQDGITKVCSYWEQDYAVSDEHTPESPQKKAEELLALMEDAARIRLRSDVPVGAYLSGGIDSAFTTALIAKHAPDRLRTFSVTFDEAELDESEYQHEVSSFLNTEHSEIRCSAKQIGATLPEVIRHTEQPILRTAPVPMYLLSRLVRQNGFKVVLTGEGADEVFGGYDIFKEAKIRRFWARNINSKKRPLLLRRLYPYMDRIQQQPAAYLSSFFSVQNENLEDPLFSHLPRWELTSRTKAFFSNEVRDELRSVNSMSEMRCGLPKAFGCWSDFCQAQYLETKFLLPGYILSSQGDRVAMAHSVEARYPFLDDKICKFASKLSPTLKMRVLKEKFLLKEAARGKVPASVLNRAKQPYRAPDGDSLLGKHAPDYVHDLLAPGAIEKAGIFQREAVTKLVAKFKSGSTTSTKDNMALVGIVSTQLLIHHFLQQSSAETVTFTPVGA
ncbi:MAG TPA: asparagine synthase (glutamine-hydrolyzing) [Terriglobales bacterium]|nr:asparagine synthase (glutamine-hydrolyzing) [Terriglobales bacterium]